MSYDELFYLACSTLKSTDEIRAFLDAEETMSQPSPHNPDKLVGTKWTAAEVEDRRKHWEVVAYRPDDGKATLRAVIDGETLEVAWRQLRDRSRWEPGWQ